MKHKASQVNALISVLRQSVKLPGTFPPPGCISCTDIIRMPYVAAWPHTALRKK
jgi:hypothetical protein